jgi:pimeloyl-ACP methyl ester carboxylesterase
MTRHDHKSAKLPDGTTIPYVEHGDPSGVPVLLLHGITDSLHSFDPIVPHLPPSVRAVAVTQRGHGDAGRPAAGYHVEDFAGDAAAFMEAVGIGSAVVVGHSMGSYVAQRVAMRYPHRVRGLVLVGSFTTLRGNAGMLEFWEQVSALRDPIDPGFAREFQLSTIARPVPDAFLDLVVAESLKVPARVWQGALQGLIVDDHSGDLGRIEAPALLVWGDRDAHMPRSEQEALLAGIERSALEVYEGVGHAPHWEDPRRFAADLAAFAAAWR